MSVTINLPAELERSVRQHAARTGQDVSEFVLQAVKEKVAKACSFDEVCAPFAEAVAASGVSDREFDHFFEQVRDEVWHEKEGSGA
ncbi:MAG TPA: ribbon-helix-helix domain-containing protein [Pirellulales bacterium]|nr:ribbon-helix-helix domain-containing protein [Pirellulales bacterium]